MERATNPWLTKKKRLDIGYGLELEVGKRIQLSENNHLRIGLQTQTCFYNYTRFDLNYVEHRAGWGFTSFLLTLGYEHRAISTARHKALPDLRIYFWFS